MEIFCKGYINSAANDEQWISIGSHSKPSCPTSIIHGREAARLNGSFSSCALASAARSYTLRGILACSNGLLHVAGEG